MRYLVTLLVLSVLALVGLGGLFWVQNSSRTTQLSLDLGFVAWQLAEPVTVPVLIAGSFSVGLLVGMLLFAIPATRNARKASRLQAELALTAGEGDGWRNPA